MSRPELVAHPRNARGEEPAQNLFTALVEAAAARTAELLEENLERQRWAVGLGGLSKYLDCSLRFARQLREKDCPAKKIGKRLIFDLREVDAWLERSDAA